MKEEQGKAICIECAHYDEEANLCTHGAGLLREIEMSDSLAEAQHGCKEFAEATYRLTPAAILELTLQEFGYNLADGEARLIFNEFMESMIKAGYIEDENKTNA